MEFEKFEEQGLKIDKNRVLTYSNIICPLDCVYCFSKEMTRESQKDAVYLNEEQLKLLKKLPETINLIMLGCDTEFFNSKIKPLETLRKLISLNKDIAIVTKKSLSIHTIEELKKINDEMIKNGNFLTISITLSSIESAKDWEPGVPSPDQRIKTLKELNKSGIDTLVAIRPLIPIISDQELKKIVELTKDYCFGFYSGPFYVKSLEHPLLKGLDLKKLKIIELNPHWMPKGNKYYQIEDLNKTDYLRNELAKHNQILFEGAADAIKCIKEKQNEKYRTKIAS